MTGLAFLVKARRRDEEAPERAEHYRCACGGLLFAVREKRWVCAGCRKAVDEVQVRG